MAVRASQLCQIGSFSDTSHKMHEIPEQCSIHFECRVVHKTNVLNADLETAIVAKTYSTGDFHRIYHGEILGVYREG